LRHEPISEGQPPTMDWLHVSIPYQTLTLHHGKRASASWPVSTGLAGAGERNGTGQTPRGWHRIRLRIGDGLPAGSVFRGRRHTGEIYDASLAAAWPGRDWILSRILWLTGTESGHNRGGTVDTLRRFIYIHGTADETNIGRPVSAGCIRMRNPDVITLFGHCFAGMPVLIEAEA